MTFRRIGLIDGKAWFGIGWGGRGMDGINYRHIDAVLKALDRYSWIVDDRLIGSCKYFMLEYADLRDGAEISRVADLEPACFAAQPKIEPMWRSALAQLAYASPVEPHPKLYLAHGRYIREIGGAFFDEAYLRCFPGAAFYPSKVGQANHSAVAAVHQGRLTGLIMSFKGEARELVDGEVADAGIYCRFACPENDFYLATSGDLIRHLITDCEEGEAEPEAFGVWCDRIAHLRAKERAASGDLATAGLRGERG